MTILQYSKLTEQSELRKLIEVVHKDPAGRVLRVSKYLEQFGKQRPVSEMIYYPDGSARLHLYSETGEVSRIYKYDKGGLEISYPAYTGQRLGGRV